MSDPGSIVPIEHVFDFEEPGCPTSHRPRDRPCPLRPFTDVTTRQLETELLGLAGHIAAAQYRFLQLLAEYDRRGGWAGPGLRSCAHWLSWRIGMSPRTATEHVRVAHALVTLPRISEAFAAGRISFSKVRALTRITGKGPAHIRESGIVAAPDTSTSSETPVPDPAPGSAADTEKTLLTLALAGTASHVETCGRGCAAGPPTSATWSCSAASTTR
jgi:hypothetical protein